MATAEHMAWPKADALLGPRLVRAALTALFALLALAAVVICTRRASGSLHEPLSAVVLVGLAVLLGAAAVAFRAGIAPVRGRTRRASQMGASGAVSLVLVLWAAGLLLPGTSVVGVVAFVGPLLVEEAWSWRRMLLVSRPVEPRSAITRLDIGGPIAIDEPLDDVGVLGQTEALDEGAMQWMVRRRDPQGAQSIEGWVRSQFEAGGRYAIAHIAICPPLERTPQCYAEQSDGPSARVKIAQVLPYGVRFEIKLDEPASEASDVTVEFSIQEHSADNGDDSA